MFEIGMKYGLQPGVVLRRRMEDRDYGSGKKISLDHVRRRLGGVNDAVLFKLIEYRGMPIPESFDPPLWDRLEWHCWFWSTRDQHNSLIDGDWSGNATAEPYQSKGDYPRYTRDWIRSAARVKGRRLTHEITIGFLNETGRDNDPDLVQRLNEQERGEVEKLCRKLPRFVMRGFGRFDRGPQRSFFHCITPESHSRFGTSVRWHFHAELFLTRREAKRFNHHWFKIENQISKCLRSYAGDREIDVELRPVDQNFSDYAHKDAEDNIAMMMCNLFETGRK